MKRLHVHIGPHKTGSTSIQKHLSANVFEILEETGCLAYDDPIVRQCATRLAAGKTEEASSLLKQIEETLRGCDTDDFLISSEDFCGLLPGSKNNRKVYPSLVENLKLIEMHFPGWQCFFYFFRREAESWVASAYAQVAKYRARFADLSAYKTFIEEETLWEGVLDRTKAEFGERLVLIPYMSGDNYSSVSALFEHIPALSDCTLSGAYETWLNAAPSENAMSVLEAVNRAECSAWAKRTARAFIFSPSEPDPQKMQFDFQPWPSTKSETAQPAPQLQRLWARVGARVRKQAIRNYLPPADTDLSAFRTEVTPSEVQAPTGRRDNIDVQYQMLEHRFRGLPKLCLLHGLVVSYLRRDTEYTHQGRLLFQRLWSEEYPLLLALLPTRWLISALQTFLDHGANEDQRVIGAAGYFFGNMIKAYEAERALDGIPADKPYEYKRPHAQQGFPGLDRFSLGRSDLIVNSNALLLELAMRDQIAGRVLEEFILRLKAASTIMSRMDESRKAHGVNVKGFENCWSFFEK